MAAIYLGGGFIPPLWCNLPGSQARRATSPPLFGFAPDGVYLASSVTGQAVRSYRTFSPLPAFRPAVCFLWHFPSGHPAWMLSSIRLYGVRTFLDPCSQRAAAASTLSFNPLWDLLIFPRNKVFARNHRKSAVDHLCECRRLFVVEPRRSSRRNCRCATAPLRDHYGSS